MPARMTVTIPGQTEDDATALISIGRLHLSLLAYHSHYLHLPHFVESPRGRATGGMEQGANAHMRPAAGTVVVRAAAV